MVVESNVQTWTSMLLTPVKLCRSPCIVLLALWILLTCFNRREGYDRSTRGDKIRMF